MGSERLIEVRVTLLFVIGLSLATTTADWFVTSGGISLWYAPASIVFAYLIAAPRLLPAIAIGAAGKAIASVVIGGSTAPLWWVGSASAVVVAAYGLVSFGIRLLTNGRALDELRSREQGILLGLVVAGPALAAGTSRSFAALVGRAEWGSVVDRATEFFIGDLVAVLSLTPLLLGVGTWLRAGARPSLLTPADDRIRELAALVVASVAIATAVTTTSLGGELTLVFLLIVPILLAAWRVGISGAVVVNATTAFTAAAAWNSSDEQTTSLLVAVTITALLAGLVVGLGTSARDHGLRALRDAEAAARAIAAEQRLFFELSSVPSLRIDVKNRRVLEVNDACLALLGRPADEIVGRPGRDLLEDPSPDEVLRARALRGETTRLVQRVRTANGPRTCEINMVSVEATGITFVQVVDLTELLDANRELSHKTEALIRKTHALQTVAARVAHDLRSPLAAVAGFASLLRERADSIPDHRRQQMLERIEANARSVAETASQVVDQATSGELTADASDDPATLFRRLRTTFDIALEAAGATLTTAAEAEQLDHPVEVVLPLVGNLVDNAIKYRHRNRPLQIQVRISANDDRLTVTVDDNGSGVGPEPDALFVSGTRGSAVEDIIGNGIGLGFARQAARELGGDITAQALAVGSRFTLHLPRTAFSHATPADILGSTFASGLRATDLDHAFDVSPVATMLIDLTGPHVVRVNHAALRLVGLTEDEFLGRSAGFLLADPAEATAIRENVQSSGHDQRIVELTTTGGRRTVDVHATAIPDTTLAAVYLLEFPVRPEGSDQPSGVLDDRTAR